MPNISAGNVASVRFAEQGSAPSTPASGYVQDYAKSDGMRYWKDDGGVEHAVGPGNGRTILTDAATVNWAASLAQAQVTLGGNRTLAAPTALLDGATYTLHVVQDGTGSRTLTWNAVFKFAGGTAPTLSTGVNKRDVFVFACDGTNFYCVAQAIDVR